MILFSNSFNQSEYLRTVAKLGQNTFDLRMMNDVSICHYILERSGLCLDGRYISSKEENYIYYHLSGKDYGDSKNIRSTIDSYRDLVVGDITNSLEENLSDDFLEKKEFIKSQYQKYVEYKRSNNLYDKHDLMNYILSSDIHIDEDCFYYIEYGVTPLFLKVLEKVFNKVTSLSILDTFKSQEKDIHFLRAYGRVVEADYVLSEIQKYPIDECQIVVTNNGDTLEIYNTLDMLGVPYTSSIGVPVISTGAGKMLKYLFELDSKSYGVDAYRDLFNCSVFDASKFKALIGEDVSNPDRVFSDFIKYAGWLRLSFKSNRSFVPNLYRKEHIEMLNKLADSLEAGVSSFIKEYLIEKDYLDEIVISDIAHIEESSKLYGFDIKDVLKDYLASYISKEVSKEGHLYISNIESASSALRKYNFVIGLTSDFPGGPKENYLIFDEEYQKTGSDMYLSTEIVKRKENLLNAFIKICPELYLTYPYFDIGGLEDQNPSSVMFKLFKGDDISIIPSLGYEDIKLSTSKEVFKARLSNLKSEVTIDNLSLHVDPAKLLDKTYSPSMFYMYFKDEYKLAFILSTLFGIEVNEEDDPYVVIPRNELGTLIHSVFEDFEKDKVERNEVLAKAEVAFDEFLEKKPPLIPSSGELAKADYLRLVGNLYDMDPGHKHIRSEQYLSGEVNGVKFHGTFDRLEVDEKGRYIIVDYKTGKRVNHDNDDPIGCLQGLIYAYLLEHYGDKYGLKNVKVDHIEFRYPESKDTATIKYSLENETTLLNMMETFKSDVINKSVFEGVDLKKQKYVDKYQHLFSLLKGIYNL